MASIERFAAYVNDQSGKGYIEVGVEKGEQRTPLKLITTDLLFVPRRIASATRKAHILAQKINEVERIKTTLSTDSDELA